MIIKRPKNRYQKGIKHYIKDVEYVSCPYCGKKMQFLHWGHLQKLHRKTIKDVRDEFPDIPTMTKKESEKRGKIRRKCNNKILTTCEKRYGGVGFASKKLDIKTRGVIKERYGNKNIMKTDHGKKFFEGELNPLKDSQTRKTHRKKLKQYYKNNPHHTKGKTYEEILGPEKAKKRRKEQVKNGQKGWLIAPKISTPQLKLFKMVKEKYPTAVLEYPILDYCLDIAVPELKLCFEYDGSYWHNPEKDKRRDEVLKKMGWKVIRYIDYLPSTV